MATNTSASAKTHVSLRLPTYILESIDAHAEKESISRTEAFVFYLQTGLDIADTKANEPSKDESMLQSIQDELAEIKALLQGQPSAAAVASAPAPATSQELSGEEVEVALSSEPETDEEDESFDASDAALVEEYAATESEMHDHLESSTTPEFDAASEELAEDEYTTSDAVSETSSSEDVSSLYAIGDTETFTEIKPVDDFGSFSTSDATYEEAEEEADASAAETDDESDLSDSVAPAFEGEDADEEEDGDTDTLSLKKLEKAVAKAAKEISSIEKVWLYGPAAESKEIAEPALDLCIKADDDEKLKSKHLSAFVEDVEQRTGKIVNVVLRHELDKDMKQAMKNKVELYKD